MCLALSLRQAPLLTPLAKCRRQLHKPHKQKLTSGRHTMNQSTRGQSVVASAALSFLCSVSLFLMAGGVTPRCPVCALCSCRGSGGGGGLVVRLHEHGCAGQHPLGCRVRALERRQEHVGGPAERRDVHLGTPPDTRPTQSVRPAGAFIPADPLEPANKNTLIAAARSPPLTGAS